jgi:hypothetical protein
MMQLIDLRCASCDTDFDDVWWDEVFRLCPICHNDSVSKVMKRAPIVDAREPFYVESLGRKFTSHHEMDAYAAKNGKVVDLVDGRKSSPTYKSTTVEERLAAGQKKADLPEIIKKASYRIRHGYQDVPPLTKEADLAKETT